MSKPSNTPARNTKVMNRFDLTSRLVAKLKNEEAVIGGIGNTNFDLWAAGHRPQNFYMLGSMGLAFPIALGVALAQPKRRVFALEGDGSLLMQIGCLSTIATLAPKNLCMIVMDNGVYQITGAQPTPAAAVSDIVAIAVGCGLANSAWAADEEDFERLIDQSLSASGPTLIGVRIDDKPGVGTTRRDPVQIRERFMLGLGVRKDDECYDRCTSCVANCVSGRKPPRAHRTRVNHTASQVRVKSNAVQQIVISRPDDNHSSGSSPGFGRRRHVRDAGSAELTAALQSRPGRRACAGVHPDRAGVRARLYPTSAADVGDRRGADRRCSKSCSSGRRDATRG